MAVGSIPAFSLPRLERREGERALNNHDVICFQLGLALQALRNICPHATFKKNDLIGYYFLHFGAPALRISETIDGALGNIWEGDERAAALKHLIPEVLGTRTTDAVMERILLEQSSGVHKPRMDSEIDGLMEVREDEDVRGNMTRYLHPRPEVGLELTLRGRSITNLGDKVVTRALKGSITCADVLMLGSSGSNKKPAIIQVISSSTPYSARVEQVRLM